MNEKQVLELMLVNVFPPNSVSDVAYRSGRDSISPSKQSRVLSASETAVLHLDKDAAKKEGGE